MNLDKNADKYSTTSGNMHASSHQQATFHAIHLHSLAEHAPALRANGQDESCNKEWILMDLDVGAM
jgi:hypothetical protein